MCNLGLLIHRFLPLVFLPQNMFKVEKVNCICVDWRHGARTDYTQAVHNLRVVGAEIAFLIQGLSVKPCLGHIPWGRGERGAGKHQDAPRGSLGTVGQGLGLDAWKQRGACPKMMLQPSASWSVLQIPGCGGAWGKLTTLGLSLPSCNKPPLQAVLGILEQAGLPNSSQPRR